MILYTGNPADVLTFQVWDERAQEWRVTSINGYVRIKATP